ncbi:hypothetical protein C8J56DRAFT_1040787 [Mycena floridula]|nr:hypothetical protein C8J56DRAFT_1040787 [Mycena floridula]
MRNLIDRHNDRKLARYLCNNHVFREVKPNVFANNRRSSILDTGKPSDELSANLSGKHDGTPMSERRLSLNVLLVRKYDRSSHCFLRRTEPIFQFTSGSRVLDKNTGVADLGSPCKASLKWKKCLKDSIGMLCLRAPLSATLEAGLAFFAKSAPGVRFVIQDLPFVVAEGQELWKNKFPDAVKSGQVKFQVHDFLTPQPVAGANVFLLKSILHNWSDEYNIKILSHLRTVATAETKHIVVGSLISYTCRLDAGETEFESPEGRIAPKPLLPSWGAAEGPVTHYTLDDIKWLFAASGWQIEKHDPGGPVVGG